MGQFFDQVQLPNWTQINSLFNPDQMQILHNQALASDSAPAQAQANTLIAQNQGATGTQDLTDRTSLRNFAPGLAARDPNAIAGTAVLPGGAPIINSLTGRDTGMGQLGIEQQKIGLGLPQLPYAPGGAAPGATAPASALPAATTDNSGGADPGGMAPGFINKLSGTESGGNAGAVNGAGYSGKLQFGTGRMTDLNMYQPAQGENPNGNQWAGTITVPGFAPMSHQQFLQNPDAQRMATEVHFKDIGNQIDNTPGAQDYNRTGLAAVAHLGGIAGMQKFVATGGQYNPSDSNGTSLQNYYNKFSAGGIPAAQAAFGHPDGPLPADHPARGVQVASADATNGMPTTANDAVPVSAGPNPAPGSTLSDTPDQLQAKIAAMRSNGVAAPVPAAPIATPAPPATPQQSQSLAIGDSIAVGVGQVNGVPSAAKVGANPSQVLQTITQMDPAQVQGRNIILSSGASNDPTAIGVVQQQIAALKAKGAASVQLLGVGDARFPGANQQLGAIAQQAGATFGGPLATGPDGVHPANYQGLGMQPAAPAAASGQPLNSLSQPPVAAVPGVQATPAQQTQGAAQPFNPMAGLPEGARPVTVGPAHLPYTQGAPAGFAWAQTQPSAQSPNGQQVLYPLVPPVLKTEKTADAILGLDPRTNQVVTRTPITETGRQTLVPTATGNQVWLNGHPTGEVIPYSGRPEQNEAYKADQQTAAGITASAQAAQGVMPRLNEMAQIQPGLATGLGGDFRAKAQAVLEQMGANPADAAKITGISSAADSDLYRKLATSTAGTAAKADLGANNGVEAMRIYQSANPGMNLQPDANKRITNMLRVQQQSVQDYAQAASQHFGDNESKFLNGGTYTPLTAFNRQWQAQANPQVYAAATGILNGDPYAKWADKLGNPADAMRAAGIAARIDPNVMVPIAGGKMQPARSLIGASP